MRIIDISVPIDDKAPLWPGNIGPKTKRLSNMENGSEYNETSIEMNVHTGTHIDAPLHFIKNGQSIDKMNPSIFIGSVFIVHLPDVREITAKDLEKINLPKNVNRILFKTSNSLLWNKDNSEFEKEYVGITSDAATWLVEKKITLVGIDYISIATFKETVGVHNILLKEGIAVLEAINLINVEEGNYKLVCLPIKITNAEGAPARAVLIK